MKKILLVIVCVLFFEEVVLFGRERLANEGKRGLYARSIEQVLRLDEDEVDLATAALIISEQWSDLVHGRRYLARLDDMALEIRERLEARKLRAKYKAVEVINEYLFEEEGFESVLEAANPNDLLLHSVLDSKRGYCLSLSILYLSLGERLGLPLHGVVVPGHFFVRYSNNGRVRFNIETTSKGGTASDEHYIKKFKVPVNAGDGIYMVNLNKIQTLGCFFNNLGNSYNDIGDMDSALRAFERAVEINPSLAEAHMNLGNAYLKSGRVEDAIYEYGVALEINPADAKAHNNLGNAYAQQGWLADAISHYTQSLELDPNFIDVYINLAAAYSRKQVFYKAISLLKKAIILEPNNSICYSRLGNVYSQLGDYEKAVFQYKKALKIKYKKAAIVKPGDSAIHYNLGVAYSNLGLYEQAVAEYRRAVEIEPEMGDAHNGLAFAFYKLKKYDLAAKHIKIAERLGVEISEDLLAAIERSFQTQ